MKKWKERVVSFAILVCIAVCLLSAYGIWQYYLVAQQNKDSFSGLAAQVEQNRDDDKDEKDNQSKDKKKTIC